MKRYFVLLLIVLVAGCISEQRVGGKIITGQCEPQIKLDESLIHQVAEQKWIENNNLVVKLLVRIKCDEYFKEASSRFEGNEIFLEYSLEKIDENSCGLCIGCEDCIHELTYVFEDLNSEESYGVEAIRK